MSKYGGRILTPELVERVNLVLESDQTAAFASRSLGKHAKADVRWFQRLVQAVRDKKFAWPPKKTITRVRVEANSSSADDDEPNEPIRNPKHGAKIKYHDKFGSNENVPVVYQALNHEITLKVACQRMGLPGTAENALKHLLWRIRHNKTTWPPVGDDDSVQDQREILPTVPDDPLPTSSAAATTSSGETAASREPHPKANRCRTSHKRLPIDGSDGLQKSESFEVRSQTGQRKAFAVPANAEKTLYYVFNQSGRKCKDHLHTQCRCRGVFRMEVNINDEWYLAKPHTGAHTEKCQPMPVYELAREQAEIQRQDLVKKGIPAYKATEVLATSVVTEVAETFGINPELLFYEVQPHYLAKRKMQKAAADKDLGRVDLNNPPEELAYLPPPLNEKRFFIGPTKTADDPAPDCAVYASDDALRHFAAAKHVVLDATFKVAPKGYYQVLIVHAAAQSSFSPVIVAFMRNKRQSNYEAVWDTVFKHMKQLDLNVKFKSAVTDFELALRNGFREKVAEYYPAHRFHLRGCTFHWAQSMMRRLGERDKNLKHLYERNPSFKIWFRCVMAIVFLPPNSIRQLWEQGIPHVLPGGLQAQMTPREIAMTMQLLDEIYAYYIGPRAVFPPTEWSQWMNFDKRTTNVCEGFHSLLRRIRAPEHGTTGRALQFFRRRHLVDLLECHWINENNRPREENALYEGVNEGVRSRCRNFVAKSAYLIQIADDYEQVRAAWHGIPNPNTPQWLYEHANYVEQRMIEDNLELFPFMPEQPTAEERLSINEVLRLFHFALVIHHTRAMGFLMFDPNRKGSNVDEEDLGPTNKEPVTGKQRAKSGQARWRALGRKVIAERRQASAVAKPPRMSRRTSGGRSLPIDPRLLVQRGSFAPALDTKRKAKRTPANKAKKTPATTQSGSALPLEAPDQQIQQLSANGISTGFCNADNRCYLISTLQTLICSDTVRDTVNEAFLGDRDAIRHLSEIIRLRCGSPASKTQIVYNFKMEVLTKMFYGDRVEADLHHNTQEDALEAMTALLGLLDDSRVHRDQDLPWHFLFCENSVCLTCTQELTNQSVLQSHHLEVAARQADGQDLQMAVHNWAHRVQPSDEGRCVVDGNTACRSEQWQSRNRIHSIPRLLIVQIKRTMRSQAVVDGMAHFSYMKDQSPVHLNDHLQLAGACAPHIEGIPSDYDIFGVVRHHSLDPRSVLRGHYYAFTKVQDQWRKYEDAQVVAVSAAEMHEDARRDAVAALYLIR